MKKYLILAIVAILVYFGHSFLLPAGGVGADSLSYFGIATDLPYPETNLFPLGYPFLVRLFFEVFHDYFYAAKFLNLFLLVSILLFSYSKSFYFRETVLLLVGKTVFYVFTGVASESVFLFLLYFLFYFVHERMRNKIGFNLFVAGSSIILILLFSVRYAGIYIYAAFGIYWLLLTMRSTENNQRKDFFWLLLISGFGIGSYLFWNVYQFGSFTGENLRGKPSEYLPVYFLRDFFGMVNAFDPFILIKPASNSIASLGVQFIIFLVDVCVIIFMIRLFKKRKHLISEQFHILLWLTAIVYILALFVSGIFQQIEEMNVRMLAAGNFLIYFSVLIMYFSGLKSDRNVFRVAVFFFIFLTVYSLKIPVNYTKYKEKVEEQMPKFSGKKYLFNDERGKVTYSTYQLPVINKELKYPHTNFQIGEIKQNIAGTKNPKIKWLKVDTVQDKSAVLYTSEIKIE